MKTRLITLMIAAIAAIALDSQQPAAAADSAQPLKKMAVDGRGNVYVADRGSSIIHKYSADGKKLADMTVPKALKINSIAVDKDENV